MDMKKILQAMDSASEKPTVETDDMKRFVSIIAEGKDPKTNRLTQAETMAHTHYAKKAQPVIKEQKRSSINKYFSQVETELKDTRANKIKQLAERVIHTNIEKSKNPPSAVMTSAKHGAKSTLSREELGGNLDAPTPGIEDLMQKYGVEKSQVVDQIKQGIEVEFEHTTDPKVALEIALDHIGEKLDYYDALKKVENPVDEEMTSAQKSKEERLKNKYDSSDMKANMIEKYGKDKGEQIYFATIRKQAMKD